MKLQNSSVDHESQLSRVSCDSNVNMNRGGTEQHENEKTLNGDECVNKDEAKLKDSIQPTTLRFEVDCSFVLGCHSCYICVCVCLGKLILPTKMNNEHIGQ